MLQITQNEIPKSTVLISSSHSECMNCHNDCIPTEGSHFTRVGYKPGDGIGCGIEWTHVTSDRAEIKEELCKDICPDLIFISMYTVVDNED